jgi:hypothetical protein
MRNFKFSTLPAIALLCVVTAGPAVAQGRGRGQAKPAKVEKSEKTEKAEKAEKAKPADARRPELGARDRDRIAAYYSTRTPGLPPGLAKRDDGLPPGLDKQIQRNGTLPPGLQKRIRPLPPALERQLLPLPAGYRRGIVDSYVIVYAPRTYLVADVLANIVR